MRSVLSSQLGEVARGLRLELHLARLPGEDARSPLEFGRPCLARWVITGGSPYALAVVLGEPGAASDARPLFDRFTALSADAAALLLPDPDAVRIARRPLPGHLRGHRPFGPGETDRLAVAWWLKTVGWATASGMATAVGPAGEDGEAVAGADELVILDDLAGRAALAAAAAPEATAGTPDEVGRAIPRLSAAPTTADHSGPSEEPGLFRPAGKGHVLVVGGRSVGFDSGETKTFRFLEEMWPQLPDGSRDVPGLISELGIRTRDPNRRSQNLCSAANAKLDLLPGFPRRLRAADPPGRVRWHPVGL